MAKARKKAGFTQTDVAEAMGLTYQQVQNYESGRTDIPFSRLHGYHKVIDSAVIDSLVRAGVLDDE